MDENVSPPGKRPSNGSLDEFQVAGLERAVMTSKSLILSARLVMEYTEPEKCPNRYGVEGIAQLASLEVRFQTQMWGEVEDSMAVC
jgi:chaperone required for assembly of F1-ATPase